ncbi:MAG: hypothetical protein ABJD68_15845 [Nakamurella sp.]
MSRGQLQALRPEEQRMLTGHELSHLRRRHHLYVHTVDLAVAANPLLHRAADAVRLRPHGRTERGRRSDPARLVLTARRRRRRIRRVQGCRLRSSGDRSVINAEGWTGRRARSCF